MFERYTEKARRVVFFARYEASQLGSNSIGTEHLLLGLIRENTGLTARIFRERKVPTGAVRAAVEGRSLQHEQVSTSVDMPLSAEAKSALAHAHEEAELLHHEHIGTEHLLLGLLWVPDGMAAEVLAQYGLRLARVREDLVGFFRQTQEGQSGQDESTPTLPKIGDIVLYHLKGKRGRITSPAIVTLVRTHETGEVALTVFHVDHGPTLVASAQPGPLAGHLPADGCWTWPSD
jgi:ATP-dependent Clp protease ATP-binding subunit ClpA